MTYLVMQDTIVIDRNNDLTKEIEICKILQEVNKVHIKK